jgi:hypothetical protein
VKLIQIKKIICVVLVCSVNVWGMEVVSPVETEVKPASVSAPAEKEIEGLVSVSLENLQGDVREIAVQRSSPGRVEQEKCYFLTQFAEIGTSSLSLYEGTFNHRSSTLGSRRHVSLVIRVPKDITHIAERDTMSVTVADKNNQLWDADSTFKGMGGKGYSALTPGPISNYPIRSLCVDGDYLFSDSYFPSIKANYNKKSGDKYATTKTVVKNGYLLAAGGGTLIYAVPEPVDWKEKLYFNVGRYMFWNRKGPFKLPNRLKIYAHFATQEYKDLTKPIDQPESLRLFFHRERDKGVVQYKTDYCLDDDELKNFTLPLAAANKDMAVVLDKHNFSDKEQNWPALQIRYLSRPDANNTELKFYNLLIGQHHSEVIKKLYIGMNNGGNGFPFYIISIGEAGVRMIFFKPGPGSSNFFKYNFSDYTNINLFPILPPGSLADDETIVASTFLQYKDHGVEKTNLYLMVQNKAATTHRLIIIDERYLDALQKAEPEQPEQ